MRLLSTDPSEPGVIAVGQVAVGIFAFGQSAHGIVAIGQLARGVVAVGQLAIGVVALGQGAVGLWFGTGMVGIAGQRGYGLVLHTLPRLVAEPAPARPPTVPVARLLAREVTTGWVAARIARDANGLRVVAVDDAVDIVTRDVDAELVRAAAVGLDAAHVEVRVNVIEEAGANYRYAPAHAELVATQLLAYPSKPRRRLSYASAPRDELGYAPPSTVSIVLRSIAWALALMLWCGVVGWPLCAALFD